MRLLVMIYVFRYHLTKSFHINHAKAAIIRITAISSKIGQMGFANFTEAQIIKMKTINATSNGKAAKTRNHQCSRTIWVTVSSGCWPEKCHFLSLPKRNWFRPKRERPERQSSSCGTSAGAAFLLFWGLLLIVSPLQVYHGT